jgi:hypothetical protein
MTAPRPTKEAVAEAIVRLEALADEIATAWHAGWPNELRDLAAIEEEGIMGIADDPRGEIVSIEKWDADTPGGKP